MSKQAIIELLNSNAAKYRKTHSRKAKGELLKQLMELTGYKSPKSIIRYFSRTRRRKRVEKRGRLPKLQPCDIELIKSIWLKSDQPQLINSGSIRARSDIITSPEQELSVSCNELLAWTSSLPPQYCTNSKYGRK